LDKKNVCNLILGLKDLVTNMINNYEINPNIDTLRHYILPYMLKNDMSGTQIINELQLLGIPSGTTTHALVLHLLSEKEIREAANIGNLLFFVNYYSNNFNYLYMYFYLFFICFAAATSRAFYIPSLIRKPLVNAFLAGNNNMTSFIMLLQQICSGLSRHALITAPSLAKQDKFNSNVNSEDQIIEMREFLGQIVIDIVQHLKQSQGVVQIVQELLEVNYINLY